MSSQTSSNKLSDPFDAKSLSAPRLIRETSSFFPPQKISASVQKAIDQENPNIPSNYLLTYTLKAAGHSRKAFNGVCCVKTVLSLPDIVQDIEGNFATLSEWNPQEELLQEIKEEEQIKRSCDASNQ